MGRKQVIAEEFEMDPLDQACLALEISEENCTIIREAAEEICTEKAKKKREIRSDYQKFISECMKAKKIKKFEEASKAMKECAASWQKAKMEE